MADFSADNVIVTNCEPSELSDFLTREEIDLLLQPFDEGEELPIISRDAKVKAEDVDSFIDAQRKREKVPKPPLPVTSKCTAMVVGK